MKGMSTSDIENHILFIVGDLNRQIRFRQERNLAFHSESLKRR